MRIKLSAATLRAALLCGALVHAAQTHAQPASAAWSTRCDASHCAASTRVRAQEPGVPYAYQLRVSRYADARTELVLLTGNRRPADDAAIGLQVDGRPVAALAAGSGYRRVGRSNTYVLGGDEAANLLTRLRGAQQLTLAFRTSTGIDETVAIRLQGLDAALARIGVTAPPAPAVASAARTQKPQQPAAALASSAPAVKPDPVKSDPVKPDPVKSDPARPKTRSAPAASSARADTVTTPPAPTRSTAPEAATRSEAPEAPGDARLPAAALDTPGTSTPGTPPGTSASGPAAPASSAQSASDAQPASVPRQFACQGNEPFWNLVIGGDNARFVSLTASGDPRAVLLQGRLQATAQSTGAAYGWRGRSAEGDSYGALIERRSCRDSMSDGGGMTTFLFAATVAAPGGLTLQGCCNAGASLDSRAGAQGEQWVQLNSLRGRAPDDWSRHLPDMLRAIDACLDRTPGADPYVTKAWPMNRGMMGVRTRNASVGWFECIAQQDGRAIERFAPVDGEAERGPDEERLVFVPAGVSRHEGNCFRHEQVLDDAGRTLGWLTTNTCWRVPGAPVAKRRKPD